MRFSHGISACLVAFAATGTQAVGLPNGSHCKVPNDCRSGVCYPVWTADKDNNVIKATLCSGSGVVGDDCGVNGINHFTCNDGMISSRNDNIGKCARS
ncbi:hypothetical protein Cob_v012818 [Colletotrichum orbiculare MAFF 240422]|uniref:Uncharacterized protein n=1 Tax=Colletotrichum orbiculare (strain 104-T / ATCC 96160 / CBS 514.97 / LARS 414 / MAFF 240422) TaxID=1213857 RepID=A0A484F855_COLOR|nr:hypothetical protein Cob_v012818 [Colletotrichum orbiculare MAFF 240422]